MTSVEKFCDDDRWKSGGGWWWIGQEELLDSGANNTWQGWWRTEFSLVEGGYKEQRAPQAARHAEMLTRVLF